MKQRGILIIIAGPSGVGKGTVRSLVMKEKSLSLSFSISFATRKPRVGEKDGVDYFFISRNEFLKRINNKDFLEYNEYVGNFYGTSKSYVESLLKKGKNVVLEIDVNGTLQIINQFKKSELISFFIAPPNLKELKKRLESRSTENDVVIKNRLANAKDEMKKKKLFDFVIVNDDAKKAAKEIVGLISNKLKNR